MFIISYIQILVGIVFMWLWGRVLVKNDIFTCVDCETTGLDPDTDSIIEIAVIRFSFSEVLQSFESLVNPNRPISIESQAIHHISDEMVADISFKMLSNCCNSCRRTNSLSPICTTNESCDKSIP